VTALGWWMMVGVVVIVVLTLGLSFMHARRRLLRREAVLYERADHTERQSRKNHDGVFAELVGIRAERDQLLVRIAELREAAASAERATQEAAAAAARALQEAREKLERTADGSTVVEARLARTERARAEAEQRVAELTSSVKAEVTSTQRKIAELDGQRRRGTMEAIEREQKLQRELERAQARARSLSIVCQLDTGPALALYADRPAPVELDAISARLRGLTLIDCATISDRHGLPLDRNGSRDADDIAAMVPTVHRVALEIESVVGTVRGVIIHTGDSRVVELRALPGWTKGAWLAVQASAQRPAPGALDAAVAYAHAVRNVVPPEEPQIILGARGRLGPGGARSDNLGDELDLATRSLGARTTALVLGGNVLTGVAVDGLTAGRLECVLQGLNQIAQAAHASLRAHAIDRIELDIVGAVRISLAQFGARSRLSLVTHTVGRTLDPLEVERVVGRLRRFLDAAPASGPTIGAVQ